MQILSAPGKCSRRAYRKKCWSISGTLPVRFTLEELTARSGGVKDAVPAILPSGDRNNAQAVYSRTAAGICAGSAGNRRPRRAGSRTLRLSDSLLFQPLLQKKPFQPSPRQYRKNAALIPKANLRMFCNSSQKNMRNFCILKVAFLRRAWKKQRGHNYGKNQIGYHRRGNMGTCHI